MKTLIIGDLHGRSIWKDIITQHNNIERIIFLGDYFDSFDISAAEQIHNFKEIIKLKESCTYEIILLIGNHDHHYLKEVGNTGTSGYQHNNALEIITIIELYKKYLQVAYKFENILCTHAGVGKVFLDYVFGKQGWSIENIDTELNALFKIQPRAFIFSGFNPNGDDIGQTPLWIRPKSLKMDSVDFKKKLIQVVGHTQMIQIPSTASTDGRYYFIDTLGTSKEYLVVTAGKIDLFALTKNHTVLPR